MHTGGRSAARPHARRAHDALTRVRLEPAPWVRLGPGEPARLPLSVANLESVHVRAYRVDLRTIFLRDGGLDGARDVQVAGVSPAWSGRRAARAGPFPREVELELPLRGRGAWLVRLDGGGASASALIVRSALTIAWEDADERLLRARRGDDPAAGVAVRALAGGSLIATATDLRGVAVVPQGAAALLFDGEDYAFTDPHARPPPPGGGGGGGGGLRRVGRDGSARGGPPPPLLPGRVLALGLRGGAERPEPGAPGQGRGALSDCAARMSTISPRAADTARASSS